MRILDSKGEPINGPEVSAEMEATAQGRAREFELELAGTRKILNADELASLVSPAARYEREFNFPDKSAYFFTINGVLLKKKIEGALFAGQCILVFGKNVLEAKDLAQRGLRKTVELLHEEHNTRAQREDSVILQGIDGPEVGGNRANRGAPMPLPQRKKMEMMIAHIFGGEPWSW